MASVKLNAVFDPATVQLMKASLEEAWEMLGPIEQAKTNKQTLAVRVLRAAAQGERDPIRLRTWALVRAVPPTIVSPGIVADG
jgi:hypothetical protein